MLAAMQLELRKEPTEAVWEHLVTADCKYQKMLAAMQLKLRKEPTEAVWEHLVTADNGRATTKTAQVTCRKRSRKPHRRIYTQQFR